MNVLVTGSSRGLGKEIIKEFARNNIDVIINYNSREDLAIELAKQINNVNVKIIKADVSNEEEVKMMFDRIDHLDYLINNAGISMDKDPLEKSALEFNKVLSTNLIGPFLCIKYASKKMTNGSIVNISSSNAIDTYYPESIDYDASKAGLVSLTNNFANYFTNIRVNAICPDWIDTDMNKEMDEEYKKNISFIEPESLAKVVYEIAVNPDMNGRIIEVKK